MRRRGVNGWRAKVEIYGYRHCSPHFFPMIYDDDAWVGHKGFLAKKQEQGILVSVGWIIGALSKSEVLALLRIVWDILVQKTAKRAIWSFRLRPRDNRTRDTNRFRN